ncbi:hypothetical protein TL16_g05505 [Triparma laevis f. inornata]|uniref:RED-like N-terminal domain-containing protein n=1 Tax=Triparma laevis f. inornata TaxID=1714386 RepID=A0A9W7AF96_9STRA|nr:hypothetical protein TL16_g05505 [Triparma laevis f. inornata]
MNNSDFLAHAVKKFDVKSSIQTFDAEKSKFKPSSDPDGDGSSEKKKPQKIYRRGKLISTSKDSASTESSKTYRDRASERKNQDSSEYASTYEMLKGFSGSAEMSQYLGGSEEFTHLVKGLDKRLAAKERDTINDKPNVSNENLNTNITSLVRRHINSDVTAISSVIKYLKGKLFVNTGEKNTKVRKEIYQFNLENERVRKIRLGGVSGGEREGVRVGEDVIKIIEAGRVKGLKIQKERKEVKMRKERIKELERKAKEEEVRNGWREAKFVYFLVNVIERVVSIRLSDLYQPFTTTITLF